MFVDSLVAATDIALELRVEASFLVKPRSFRKKQCDETNSNEAILQAEKDFEVSYFNSSLKSIFKELQSFNEKNRISNEFNILEVI
jgi:hypothetical protein